MPSITHRTSQITAFQHGLDAQFSFMTEFTRRSCDSLRRLNELNLQFVQQAVQDSVDATRMVLSCSDPLQMMATAARATQPASRHWQIYRQQLAGIMGGVQAALTRTASAAQAEQLYGATAGLRAADDASSEGASAPGPDPLSSALRGNGASHVSS